MSCCDSSSDKPSHKSNPDHDGVLQSIIKFIPEGSALLSCSCCWLPTVLDFLFAGSVAAANVEKLRHVFLAISILTLIWGVRREGFSRRMVVRISICVGLAAWAQVNRWGEVGKGHHSCH